MARMSNTDYLIYFDVKRFEVEMRKALRKATAKVQETLIENINRNISDMDFKDNTVRLAGGRETSDAVRKSALLKSVKKEGHIKTHIVNFSKYKEGIMIKAAVSAMNVNFKDSHVGWYYEIGTGEQSDPEGYSKYGFRDLVSIGHENPYRLPDVGSPIVSRNREHGYWVDLGGNLRETGSNIGGIGNPTLPEGMDPVTYGHLIYKFRKYIGRDIEAYYWFERAVEETSRVILDIYMDAIRSVNIFNPSLRIIHINRKVTIGEKYTVTKKGGWGDANYSIIQ